MGNDHKSAYLRLLRHARRHVRNPDDAEDVVQEVLLAALKAGRLDMSQPRNRAWAMGALRKRAAFEARGAVRRRAREAGSDLSAPDAPDLDAGVDAFVGGLPKSLRTTGLLALTGHTKSEIIWLLGISDAALRQRFVEIKKRWTTMGGGAVGGPFLGGNLEFGRIRQTLLRLAKQREIVLASHDPDGHLFLVTSQNGGGRQLYNTR